MSCLCSQCTVKNCDKKKSLKRRVQGKKNRSTGYYAEKKLLKLFTDWNIPISQTVASGRLKNVSNKVKQKYLFSGDFYCDNLVKGKRLKIENKKRVYSVFKRYYTLTENQIYHIKNLCYLVSQDTLKHIIDGKEIVDKITDNEDKQFKMLHTFFEQDNADIVSMISPSEDSNRYMNFIFAIKENIFKRLIKERGMSNE